MITDCFELPQNFNVGFRSPSLSHKYGNYLILYLENLGMLAT